MKTISVLAIIAFMFIGCEKRADSQIDNDADLNDTIMTEDMDMNNQGNMQDTMNMDTHPNDETRTLDNNRGMNETDTTTNRMDTVNATR